MCLCCRCTCAAACCRRHRAARLRPGQSAAREVVPRVTWPDAVLRVPDMVKGRFEASWTAVGTIMQAVTTGVVLGMPAAAMQAVEPSGRIHAALLRHRSMHARCAMHACRCSALPQLRLPARVQTALRIASACVSQLLVWPVSRLHPQRLVVLWSSSRHGWLWLCSSRHGWRRPHEATHLDADTSQTAAAAAMHVCALSRCCLEQRKLIVKYDVLILTAACSCVNEATLPRVKSWPTCYACLHARVLVPTPINHANTDPLPRPSELRLMGPLCSEQCVQCCSAA
jgi:hypothetical protein